MFIFSLLKGSDSSFRKKQLHPQYFEQCLAHRRCSGNVPGVNEDWWGHEPRKPVDSPLWFVCSLPCPVCPDLYLWPPKASCCLWISLLSNISFLTETGVWQTLPKSPDFLGSRSRVQTPPHPSLPPSCFGNQIWVCLCVCMRVHTHPLGERITASLSSVLPQLRSIPA